MLREIGGNVVEAVSAYHAINLLQTSLQTELLFIDSEIADLTPDELCGRAKALRPSLKFLIAVEPLSTICMDGSDWHHIEKPFGQDDVALALERMFGIPNAC